MSKEYGLYTPRPPRRQGKKKPCCEHCSKGKPRLPQYFWMDLATLAVGLISLGLVMMLIAATLLGGAATTAAYLLLAIATTATIAFILLDEKKHRK